MSSVLIFRPDAGTGIKKLKNNGKGKVYPRTGHESPKGE
jgi:hypothetical protein